MNITEQPNEILNMLLNTEIIPLRQRIRLRSVCRRWLAVLEDGLAQKTTLTIYDDADFYSSKRTPDDLLLPSDSFTFELILLLSRLFPATTGLTVYFAKDASWFLLPSLLAYLANNCSTVKLYSDHYYENRLASTVFAIKLSLNGLYLLSSLLLPRWMFTGHLQATLGAALSRLEKLAVQGADKSVALHLSSSLSPRCTHLMLHDDTFAAFPHTFIAQLSSSLTHLHLLNCWKSTLTRNAENSLSKLNRLTSLTIYYSSSISLEASIFSGLSSFANLTDLQLAWLSYNTPFASPFDRAHPFPNIKTLTLGITFSYYPTYNPAIHHGHFFPGIGACFPGLTRLTLFCTRSSIPRVYADLEESLLKISYFVEILDSQLSKCCSCSW